MSQLKAYPEYKDSGVEWIREIPIDWEVFGLTKALDSIIDYRGKTPKKIDKGIFLVTAKNIKNGTINYNLSKEYINPLKLDEVMRRGRPKKGDVLFTTEAPLGEVANVDDENIALAQRVIKFRGKENILNNYFLKYWIMSQGFQDNLRTFATGSTVEGIKSSKLNSLLGVLPSYSEQLIIKLFLNKKTSEIDNLISDKERLIELLEEKRQAVITETVTKGLDSDVKMKDSGIEWIGDIPEHWEVSRIKYNSKINNKTLGEKTDQFKEIRYIDIGNVTSNGDIKTIEKHIFKNAPSRARRVLSKGDTIISTVRTYLKSITWIEGNTENLIASTGFTVLTPRNTIEDKYLSYLMRTENYIDEIVARSVGVSYPAINASQIGDLYCILPPKDEQREIVAYIKLSLLKLDQIKIEQEKQISKLTEYRESLIYEAVTGKIDVRDYAVEKEEIY